MAFAMAWPNAVIGGNRGNQHTGGKFLQETCQKAMRWAMLYPGNGKKGGDRKSNISNIFDSEPEGVSRVYVAKARARTGHLPRARAG